MQDPLASDYINDDILCEYCYDLSFWRDLKELTFILTPMNDKFTLLEGDMYVTLGC
jgi:hypothetical protein